MYISNQINHISFYVLVLPSLVGHDTTSLQSLLKIYGEGGESTEFHQGLRKLHYSPPPFVSPENEHSLNVSPFVI